MKGMANVAENALDGRLKTIDDEVFQAIWDEDDNSKMYFLDCREHPDALPFLEKYPGTWHNIPLSEL